MNAWVGIPPSTWSYSKGVLAGLGAGVGPLATSYAYFREKGRLLNGRIEAELRPSGGNGHATCGLGCRADTSWSFALMLIAPQAQGSELFSLRLGYFKEGRLNQLVASKELFRLPESFLHASLLFQGARLSARVTLENQSISVAQNIPHIPFPGFPAIFRLFDTDLTAKRVRIATSTEMSEIVEPDLSKKEAFDFDVFICHSSKDKEIVRELVDDLHRRGIKYWVDHEQIGIGDATMGRIEDGLKRSRHVLVCLSSNLSHSKWTQAEYSSLLRRSREDRSVSGRKVVPLKIGDLPDRDIPNLLDDIKRADRSQPEEYEALLAYLAEPQATRPSLE